MWAVVPAAGRSSRLAAVTSGIPKGLLEVGGRPVLDWLIERMSPVVSDACLVVSDVDGPIGAALGSERHGIRLHYATQPERRGVGDAIRFAQGLVKGPFVVAMGDVFYEQSLVACAEAWRSSGVDGAVLVEPITQPTAVRAGWVRCNDGFVRAIEKTVFMDGATHRVCGMAILPVQAFDVADVLADQANEELELEEIIHALMREQGLRFLAVPYDGWRRNINTPDDLRIVRGRVDVGGATWAHHADA